MNSVLRPLMVLTCSTCTHTQNSPLEFIWRRSSSKFHQGAQITLTIFYADFCRHSIKTCKTWPGYLNPCQSLPSVAIDDRKHFQYLLIKYYYHLKQIFLSFHCIFSIFLNKLETWEPTTWPANNCLQIMVCSCAMPPNCVWLQIIFCTCVKGTRPNIGREPDHGKRTRLIFRLVGIGTDL